MNTFKAILMICATLSASCSGQYMSQSSSAQGWAPAVGPTTASYGDLSGMKGQSQQMPFASPSQGQYNAPAAGTGAGSRPTAPVATTQICTCITVNAGQQTADNSGSSQATAPISAPAQTFVAPAASSSASQQGYASQSSPTQTFVAPAASSSASQQGYASQSAPAQAGGDNRAPMAAAYPAAAAPANNNGGY